MSIHSGIFIAGRDYDNWIHQQLEPTSIIIRGSYRRHHEIKKELVLTKPPVRLSEEEDEKRQDSFLAARGVDVSRGTKK